MSENQSNVGEKLAEALNVVAEELDVSREELRAGLEERDQKTQVLLEQIKDLLVDQAKALSDFRAEVLNRLKDVETDTTALKKKSANGNGLHAL